MDGLQRRGFSHELVLWLLKLGMNTREVADYLRTSHTAIRNHKVRARRNGDLQT